MPSHSAFRMIAVTPLPQARRVVTSAESSSATLLAIGIEAGLAIGARFASPSDAPP